MAIASSMDLFSHIPAEYLARWFARIEEVKQSGALIGVESPLLGEGAQLSRRNAVAFRFVPTSSRATPTELQRACRASSRKS